MRVILPGFVSVTESVSVSEGKLERLRLELPSDPQVAVTCVPGGVVFVDGERVGPTPQLMARKAGRYEVACEFGGLRESRSLSLSDRREEQLLTVASAKSSRLSTIYMGRSGTQDIRAARSWTQRP